MKHVLLFESYFTESVRPGFSESEMEIKRKFKSLGSNASPDEIADIFLEYIEASPNIDEAKRVYQMLMDDHDFAVDYRVLGTKNSPSSQAKIKSARALVDYGKELGLL
jgi:hypothetical protein